MNDAELQVYLDRIKATWGSLSGLDAMLADIEAERHMSTSANIVLRAAVLRRLESKVAEFPRLYREYP